MDIKQNAEKDGLRKTLTGAYRKLSSLLSGISLLRIFIQSMAVTYSY
jgi:hypothetical protein